MGKETKIGLAVIGVLVTVFSVLLFRQFGGPTAALREARAPVQPLSSAGMSKENVVVTSKDSGSLSSKLWDTPTASSDESAGQAPAASYMPAENAAAASDPYAEPATQAATGLPAGQGTEEVAATPAAQLAASPEAQELPRTDATENRQARNPLRRLSAELPLDASQQAAGAEAVVSEPAMTLPTADEPTSADPYSPDPAGSPSAVAEQAVEAPAAGAEEMQAAHRNPFDVAPQAQLVPSDGSFEPEPEVQKEVDAVTGQPPAATEAVDETVPAASQPSSAFDKFEQPPAAQPAADDWQASEPVAAPRTVAPQAAAPLAADVAAAPLPVTNGQYTVQPGDTLWSISEKVYGTGGYFKALGARNRSSLPRSDKLTVGTQIAVPPTAELERDFASLCPKQRKSALVRPRSTPPAGSQQRSGSDVYIVNEGDTLFDIARHELGKATRWAEIYDLNRDVLGEDFDYLRPGTELTMPARTEAAAKPADSRYQ